ncbi:MAG: hypothetical protein WBM17_00915 [Anaerolineales bacterium]
MKRLAWLSLLLAMAACQPAAAEAPSTLAPAATTVAAKPTATEISPVYVPALCTLMGRDVRSDFPAGHPAIVIWGWSAAMEEQVRDYIRVGKVVVTFDGVEIFGQQQGDIPYDETAKLYKAVWMSNAGIPKPGIHKITYLLTFSEKLFDGFDYYGPGTDKEKQEDKCEIEVK